MKETSSLLNFNAHAFNEFIKLNTIEKYNLLFKSGLLVDNYIEKDFLLNLYFINGFFVEVLLSKEENTIMDIVPFKQGYNTKWYLEVKEIVVARTTIH